MLVLAWVAMAPTPASTWGTLLPTAGTAVETHTPRADVFGHRATIENVVKIFNKVTSWFRNKLIIVNACLEEEL